MTKKMKIILATGAGILLMALLAGGYYFYVYLQDPSRVFKQDHSGDPEWDNKFDRDVINVVLLGFDRNEGRDRYYRIYRPDTIMIGSINFRTGEVNVVSIPRDSYVKIAGTEGIYDKINHSYMYGYDRPGPGDPHRNGINNTIKTIEDFLGGVPVHYYVALDMDGVVEIIDRVGGIYYDVDVQVRFSSGRLLVDKGYQLLDGKKFMYYVRYRGTGGDTGRTGRQQDILISAFSQLKQRGKITQVPQIYNSLSQNVETNLSTTQILSLALFGMKVEPGSINSHTFKGSGQFAPRNGLNISYHVIDEQARVELIRHIFGVTVDARPQITLRGRIQPPDPDLPSDENLLSEEEDHDPFYPLEPEDPVEEPVDEPVVEEPVEEEPVEEDPEEEPEEPKPPEKDPDEPGPPGSP